MSKDKKLDELIKSVTLKKKEKIDRESKFIGSESYRVELADGSSFVREKLLRPNGDGSAIVIVPVFENGDVLLCIEPRVFTETGVGVGFPAGYIEEGETAIEAGRRELLEESGVTSSRVIDLGGHYQDSGISGAYNHVLVAFDAEVTDCQHLDEGEYIKTYRCPLSFAIELFEEGIINDANSVIALLRLNKYMKENNICLTQEKKKKK